MNSRKYLASLLALLCVLTVGALTASVADALEISRFDANRVHDLSPGTDLTFRLEGTPQATAMVTVSGLRQPITLRETDTGWYEGSYTIRTGDRLPSHPDVRATLRQGNRTTTAGLASSPHIQRFTMEPNRIEPGTELVFTLEGTPHATATVTIRNVARDMPMTETQSGVYEGRYTVRQQERVSANTVTATLEANGQVERTQLAAQMGPGNAPTGSSRQAGFPLEVTSPTNMAAVHKGPVDVTGRSAPHLPLHVHVEATHALSGLMGGKQSVLSSTVTTDENGNFSFRFEPPTITVPGTRYEVNISGTMAGQEKKKQLTLVQR